VRHRPRPLGRHDHGHDPDRWPDHAQPLGQHRPGGDDPPDGTAPACRRRQLSSLINTESGLKGISGISSDIHDIEAAASDGHHRALLAHKAFCYQVRKNIGAYVAAMGGIDVLAFTGDVGETSATVRSLACQGLGYMGIKLDEEKNRNLGKLRFPRRHFRRRFAGHHPCHRQRRRTPGGLGNPARHRAQPAAARSQGRRRPPIPIEISAHHVHLSQADVEKLFGPGHQLTPEHELSQPGQFACAEKVHLVGPKGRIANVRVLGPTRKETQVEIAMTEQFKVGIQPPIRQSGDLANTPGITLEGPATAAPPSSAASSAPSATST
jgi:acetate kinase